ncbi:prolyl oligopeptidase family serine peptidase [Deinococcus multiflagellatus]|uniref:prolyl oligopeptidase family serine peptidase n=1 Tax=Deinococcus multiflagellatus TaxID=1656887 RepID=UPI001CCDE420|nr:prolyl oligopeptidase family serine peptidase [Deinococcus multiflagellatus]MBZ9713957.1 prolyl oligopeptidase family serine peptidase [Deinococcus multiflagellatus]
MTSTQQRPVPVSHRGDHVDLYTNARGEAVAVPDPYRWLEDPDSPDTRAWVAAQNEATQAFLSDLPARAHYQERLTALWDYAKTGVPWQRGGRYFRMYNPGLLNQPVLQVAPAATGPWEVLLDPNALSEDGTVALVQAAVSRDGEVLAYATQSGGSDWQTWRVRDVALGQDLGDELAWSKFSGAAWLPDGSGFFYSAYDAPAPGEALTGANRHQRLMLHRLGTPQAEDALVLARPDQPDWGFHASVTEDARSLVVHVWQGTDPRGLLWVRPLDSDGPFTELVPEFRAAYRMVGSNGDTLFVQTDEDAPRGRLLAWNVVTGERQELIPEGPDKLEEVCVVPDGLLALTLRDASHRLTLHDRAGAQRRDIALPALGTVILSTRPDSAEVFFGFASFLSPNMLYRLELPGGELELLAAPELTFDPSPYEITQAFATGKDGTRVPLFIVARRDAPRDGTNPVLLYGYGGFNISLTPAFSPSRLAWLERGGVYVQANLRGGGEYGEEWHQAGTLGNKQNVFDDFIACAEHLIAGGWTTPQRLAIQGGSNGGLLVGACLTQRPDLFGAAVPQVGVLDMLRYHLFTIGWAWASDYGRSDDPAMLEVLRAYSPLHNLTEGVAYPATLITTGDHDDRVVPAHSFKFGAELQCAQGGNAPVLLRIQTRAGHGAGKPTALVIEEAADIYAFLERALGMA